MVKRKICREDEESIIRALKKQCITSSGFAHDEVCLKINKRKRVQENYDNEDDNHYYDKLNELQLTIEKQGFARDAAERKNKKLIKLLSKYLIEKEDLQKKYSECCIRIHNLELRQQKNSKNTVQKCIIKDNIFQPKYVSF